MIIFFILPLLAFAISPFHLLDFLAKPSALFQMFCSEMIPPSELQPLNQAVVCGTTLPPGEIKQIFVQSGLYHLVVVSQGHLVFLSLCWQWMVSHVPVRWRPLRAVPVFGFILYTLMTGLQPPLVRGGLAFLLDGLSHRFRWNWGPVMFTLVSTVLCLCLSPSWVQSPSLLLSTMASVALQSSLLIRHSQFRALVSCSAVYFFTLPILCGLGIPHPISIAANLLITPLLEVTLLPFSFGTFVFHFLAPITDFLTSLFLKVLGTLIAPFPIVETDLQFSQTLLWLYVGALSLLLHFAIIHVRRRSS